MKVSASLEILWLFETRKFIHIIVPWLLMQSIGLYKFLYVLWYKHTHTYRIAMSADIFVNVDGSKEGPRSFSCCN